MNKTTSEEISFGKWLRQRRHLLDLTQQQLADQAGCARITLRRIESGGLKPSKELANVLLEKLGIPASERPAWILFARELAGYPDRPVPTSPRQKPKNNVPIALTSFVGREDDLERIKRRLAEHRLVTLTGAGGIGKTRLSLEVGRQLLHDYPDGVWFVELAALNDPALVPQTIAGVFGVQPRSDRQLIEILIHVLRNKTIMLILDNCEHLLDGCAQLSDKLLKNCPGLRILATSRERLGVVGEALYPVPALATPDIEDIESLDKLKEYEALHLFDERAQLINMDFALTMENLPFIARICARLDGMPLAIELAAARVHTFSPEQIASQLEDRFQLLTVTNSSELPKHQSLRASMDWSWELLSDGEQIVFRRLSVFASGFTFESASHVCGSYEIDVPITIIQLMTKSLIVQDHTSRHEQRYYLLETVRQYSYEKLVEGTEEDRIRTSHLEYFLNFSQQAEIALKGPTQDVWYSRLLNERDNIRAALAWANDTDIEAGLYISGRLHRFWQNFDLHEGAMWLAKFLEKPGSKIYPLARAKALYTQTWMLLWAQKFDQASVTAQECVQLYKACKDRVGEIDGLFALGASKDSSLKMELEEIYKQALDLSISLGDQWRQAQTLVQMSWFENDYQNRISHMEEAVALFKRVGDLESSSEHISWLANLELTNGNLRSAENWLGELIRVDQHLNTKWLKCGVLELSGSISLIKGNYERARIELQEAIELSHSLGHRWGVLWSRARLGYVELRDGNAREASEIFIDTAQKFQSDQFLEGAVFTLEGMAELFVAMEQPEPAAQLIGWADEMRVKLGDPRPKLEQADIDKVIAACIEKLRREKFSELYEEGKRITLDEAVEYALNEA